MTWLASWTENIQSQIKYVMLNPSSRLKGEKDMEKYEKARILKDKIVKIRTDYTEGKSVRYVIRGLIDWSPKSKSIEWAAVVAQG